MSDESKKDRSPNYPKLTLAAAIDTVKALYNKIGKGKVKREVAVGALGYSSLSGASLTVLGALNQYGLIDQDKAVGMSVSQLAVSLLHPLNETQEREAKVAAALSPKVFNVLYTEGFHHASENALANNLIQNGFTPDGAKRAASVYLENISFANLTNEGINKQSDNKNTEKTNFSLDDAPQSIKDYHEEVTAANEKNKGKKVLAQYSIPIGASEATITFTGERLSVEDFDALADYIAIFKKQFERKKKSEEAQNVMSHIAGMSTVVKDLKSETTPSIAKLAGFVK